MYLVNLKEIAHHLFNIPVFKHQVHAFVCITESFSNTCTMDANNKSPHILNTSATLFGLCFVVITSLKALKISGETLIDEFTAVAMLMFMASSLFSFLSIRSSSKKSQQFEKIADYGFLTGLLILFAATIFLLLNFIA